MQRQSYCFIIIFLRSGTKPLLVTYPAVIWVVIDGQIMHVNRNTRFSVFIINDFPGCLHFAAHETDHIKMIRMVDIRPMRKRAGATDPVKEFIVSADYFSSLF